MIGDQKNRPLVIDRFKILQSINTHQIVRGKVNPTRAEETLAPGPETLPATQIHAVSEAESKAFEGRKDGEFF